MVRHEHIGKRSWWTHALFALALLMVTLVAVVSIVVPWAFAAGQFGCSSFDSEYDTADASLRGRFACGDSPAPEIVALVCAGIVLVLIVSALVVWVRRGHIAVFVALTVLVAVVPCVAGVAVMALPTECSEEQAAKDPEGCVLP